MMKVTLMTSKNKIAVLAAFLLFSFSYQDKAENLVKSIQAKYKGFKDFQVEFTQISYSEFENDSTFSSGKLYIKDKKYFRLETEYETIITDEKVIYTLNKTRRQLLIEDADKEEDDIFFPRKILFKYPDDYEISLIGMENIEGKNSYKIHFISKEVDNIISEFTVWAEKETLLINSLKTIDLNENISIYGLKNFKGNQNLQKIFFGIPDDKDIEVIDMRGN
ncbi:outer membrane lipoprotein carrier protein LolA [candidate division KSB1 bacterium]